MAQFWADGFWAEGFWEDEFWAEEVENVPGQEGELNASARLVRQAGMSSIIRRAALCLALLLLGAL